MNRNKH